MAAASWVEVLEVLFEHNTSVPEDFSVPLESLFQQVPFFWSQIQILSSCLHSGFGCDLVYSIFRIFINSWSSESWFYIINKESILELIFCISIHISYLIQFLSSQTYGHLPHDPLELISAHSHLPQLVKIFKKLIYTNSFLNTICSQFLHHISAIHFCIILHL